MEARLADGDRIAEARRLLASGYTVAADCTARVGLERSVWRIVDKAGLWADVRPYIGCGPALHALRVKRFLSDDVKRETGELYADLSRV
ncbi:hypothetical protein, partial [Botrimarina hoheduenensis]|uniref:hypothetical protein n=1 Tax=Botrimarina hoheduenensis TaxID=2528000 RepID=UPI0018D360F8